MQIIIDGHNDTMMHLIDEDSYLPVRDLSQSLELDIDLDKLEAGGLNAPIFAAFSEGYYKDGRVQVEKSLKRSLALINALHHTAGKNQNRMGLARNSQDIKKLVEDGKIAALSSIEGAYFIDEENCQEILYQLADIGVIMLGFTWNYSNNLGQGLSGNFSDGKTKSEVGLSQLGIKALARMEELGILVDVSHMSQESFYDLVENYQGPIVASHSAVYELRQHARNLKDDQIRAIAKSGGLVGLVLADGFLSSDGASLDDFIDHMEYIIKLVGIDHVGLGSDFDGAKLPRDLKDASKVYKIVELLRQRGYREQELEKILSGNFIRVMDQAQARAKKRPGLDLDLTTNIKGQKIQSDRLEFKIQGQGSYLVELIIDGLSMEKIQAEAGRTHGLKYKFKGQGFHLVSLKISKEAASFSQTYLVYNG